MLRVDYALFYKASISLAVIEAKHNTRAVGVGMPQAINDAELLCVPFLFASNGDSFVFRDATMVNGVLKSSLTLDQSNIPTDLWERLCAAKGWTLAGGDLTEHPYAPHMTPRELRTV